MDITMSWSDLPADLAAGIAERMSGHADLARFRSVCSSWSSASMVHATRRRVPLLLLSPEHKCHVDRRLWSLADDSVVKIPVPAARGNSFLFASPQGWALAVDSDFSATLLHLFTGASAILPPLPRSLSVNFVVRDMVWDWSPHAVMIARTRGRVSCFCAFFCRPGDGSWSPVECSELDEVSSITYCDGVFYLFDGETRRTVGLDSETFAVTSVIQPPVMVMPEHLRRGAPFGRRKVESTLVVSPGELLVIVRTHLLHPGASNGSGELFKAFRCRLGRRTLIPTRWAGVDDIGDRAVFVDSVRGFCVEANGLNGVRRNCMYVASSYQDANGDSRYTVSVLDLARLTTERLSLGNLGNCRCHGGFWQWPSWSMPNLQPRAAKKTARFHGIKVAGIRAFFEGRIEGC